MKKLVVVLLAFVALFLAVSCSDDPSARNTAAGKVGAAVVEAVTRQPEMKEKVDAFADFVYKVIYDKDIDANKVDGIATAAAGVITSMARQPEAMEKILGEFAVTYELIVGEEMPEFTFPTEN